MDIDWSQIIFREVGSDISQFAFKRPVDLPLYEEIFLDTDPTTMCVLTKNSKNFQAPLHQVLKASYIVSDPLE